MKRLIILAASVGIMTFWMGTAKATSFQDVHDFDDGSGRTYQGATYIELSDSNSGGFVGTYQHMLQFDPAVYIDPNSVDLVITYALIDDQMTGNGLQEIWFVYDTGGARIGQLTNYDDKDWHTETFHVDTSDLPVTSWTIGFKFYEDTLGNDKFYLDKSELTGEYTPVSSPDFAASGPAPVPEPATLLLVGSGLIGMAGYARKRRG